MLIYEDESLGIESDQERRRKLRTFLMSCRSRLGPSGLFYRQRCLGS